MAISSHWHIGVSHWSCIGGTFSVPLHDPFFFFPPKARHIWNCINKNVASSLSDFSPLLTLVKSHLEDCVRFCAASTRKTLTFWSEFSGAQPV